VEKHSLSSSFLFFIACASYYNANLQFQEHFVRNEIEQADRVLDDNKDEAEGKNRLLYLLQKGTVLQLLDQYDESNRYFEDAYIYTEDYQENYAAQALSLISNPTVIPYRGEDYEIVQIHYFKALNYLMQKQYDEALIECRRINIKLNEINDRYEDRKNRYKTDAFALNLMGMIYEATKEYNNAFISYRNAYEAYEQIYTPSFGVHAPRQLKLDLLRTAYLNGFTEELNFYEKQFDINYQYTEHQNGELIIFWNNGLGPVKDEWSINFFIVKGSGGIVSFVNDEYGLNFPFSVSSSGESSKLSALKLNSVAIPKFLERKPFYKTARVRLSDQTFNFELGQDINKLAFTTLEDRMLREFMTSLLRLALKQTSEELLRKKNANLGALLSLVNAVSEKADTRNWQTLPYSISYLRIPLNEGENPLDMEFTAPSGNTSYQQKLMFQGEKGETQFHFYYTLESLPLN